MATIVNDRDVLLQAAATRTLTAAVLPGFTVQDAVDALADAAAAQADATSALNQLTNIASDSILSPVEKPAVVQDYSVIIAEQSGIDAQATAYSITTEKTAYDNAVSALTTYLGTLSGWNTIPGSDVAIVGTTFRSKFSDVYTTKQALLDKIAANAKVLADDAQTAADDAQTDATSALSAIANIASDAVLSKGEKPAVVLNYNAIINEQSGIDTQATSFGITTEKTTYDNAITALTTYITGLSPAYTDYTADTVIVSSTFNTKFADVYSAKQALLNKIAELAAGGTLTENNAITASMINDINADTINAGSIRGINVNAASHTTKGSYLTSAASAADTTLYVKNTDDFSSGGGSGWFIDTTNDRDEFTYTGKTSSTLTGCSGVLAHNNGATIIPQVKCIVIDAAVNEQRFFWDRGDGTVEEMASIGVDSSGGHYYSAIFGSASGSSIYRGVLGLSYDGIGLHGISSIYQGVRGESDSDIGVAGYSNSSIGMKGTSSGASYGVMGVSNSSYGIYGSSTSGNGGYFAANATKGNLHLPPVTSNPSSVTAGQFANINGKLCYSDGTNWRRVSDDVIV